MRVREQATYADLLKVPDTMVAEIIEGELYASPRPGLPHADATTELTSRLRVTYGRRGGPPGGWHILFEPELHLGRDILVPDIAGWRVERVPALPHTAAIDIAPDWICEVVSPSTMRVDRAVKMPIYARHAVQYAWLVDPEAQTLEVRQLTEDGRWSEIGVYTADAVVRAVPFEEVEIDLASIWGPPPA
ncbi:MAG TPA: Uma2 family endonuclease [Thermoanaerobaculia bacterium]|nr:Uma2 family endonuclease [Thermoanaerobaculia bacterium]